MNVAFQDSQHQESIRDGDRDTASKAQSRIPELDALRGLAAVGVMLFHYTSLYSWQIDPAASPPISFRIGNYGVELFFILSGFVIPMTLDRKKTVKDFAVARFRRLYPPFWVSVVVTFFIVTLFGNIDRAVSFTALMANFTMLPMVFFQPCVDSAYWTLHFEIFFYFWIAVVYFLVPHKFRNYTIFSWLGLSFLLAIPDVLGFGDLGILRLLRAGLVLKYIPLFLIGYSFWNLRKEIWSMGGAWLFVGLCSFCFGLIHGLEKGVMACILSIIFFVVIRRRVPGLKQPFLLFLGAISYPLYLLNQNVGYVIIRGITDRGLPHLLGMGAAILCSIGLAYLVHHYVEKPAMKIR